MTFPVVELSEVADLDRRSLAADEIKPGSRYLGLEHIESGGEILGAVEVERGEIKSSKFQFSSEHVLYGKLRPYLAKIALPSFAGICSTDIVPLRPGPKLDRRYLAYLLRSDHMVDYANSRASGANLPRLSPKELARLPIPLPRLAEQKRIAKILDAADALRAKRRESLAQLDALLQSTFIEMFGDPVENPRGWVVLPLSDLLTELYRYPTYYGIDYVESGVPELRGELIGQRGEVNADPDSLRFISKATSEKFPRTELLEGDLVMTVRGTIGKIGRVPKALHGANMTANLIRISPNRQVLNETYFLHFCLSKHFTRWLSRGSSSTTIKTIKAPHLRATPVPLPPMEKQLVFEGTIQQIERLRTLEMKQLKDFEELFTSLQQRAFAGQL